MRLRRKAFTLIEVLIAIAIIGVLVAMVTLGITHLGKSSRQQLTRTSMENLKGLVVEREKAGGMQPINALYPPPPDPLAFRAPGDMRETPDTANTVSGPPKGDRYPIYTGPPAAPVPQNEIARTQVVMNLLRAVPLNRQMLAGLPTSSIMAMPAGTPTAPPVRTAPIMLDGWGNPMIYVPPLGMPAVVVSGDDPATGATEEVRFILVTAPDGRGFWASAGADGVFTDVTTAPLANKKPFGDDNVYSFEN